MKLRELKIKDASLMLEWMHDKNVTEFLSQDFNNKSLDDCIKFINNSFHDSENKHFAIVDDNDEYLGTASLKNIKFHTAEFAIVVRKCAMGNGYASYAMKEIIDYGISVLDIYFYYWCVNKDNHRAINFYNKNGCLIIDPIELRNIMHNNDVNIADNNDLMWYKKSVDKNN